MLEVNYINSLAMLFKHITTDITEDEVFNKLKKIQENKMTTEERWEIYHKVKI